jgi:hypothetical protein
MFIGQPCDEDGNPFGPASASSSSPITETRDPIDWTPFRSRVDFETAGFLYKRCQMSGSNIDTLMELWAAHSVLLRDHPQDMSESSGSSLNLSPFSDHRDMYSKIDAIQIGGVPWQSITLSFDGPIPDSENPPSWMKAGHTVWFREPRLLFKKMLENPDFRDFFDYAPYRQYDTNGQRRYQNFMSGDWAWKQAVSTCSFLLQVYICNILMWSPRMSSLRTRIPRYMEHYMCPLSSAAIKQLFLWQPGTTNIGLSMLL